MNALTTNELLGSVALQTALQHAPESRLPLSKAFLILPLLFDGNIRKILKDRRSVVVSCKDLILSRPEAFTTVSARFSDLFLTSLNTIVLACEMGMTQLVGGDVMLMEVFFDDNRPARMGKTASDIMRAGPHLATLLREPVIDLYQTLRIAL
ncbi:three component ABC system middle component [Caballeronia sp. AZ10_KS36]|uniref:three component ABC system middle component n=1 Tax=Caballeronia sp. AZ10_KS36 TaxID=2921757 RepID=UPI0020288D27|nr:three component ABC system middle component [Caballeronia sp. AZ10_KS36]